MDEGKVSKISVKKMNEMMNDPENTGRIGATGEKQKTDETFCSGCISHPGFLRHGRQGSFAVKKYATKENDP